MVPVWYLPGISGKILGQAFLKKHNAYNYTKKIKIEHSFTYDKFRCNLQRENFDNRVYPFFTIVFQFMKRKHFHTHSYFSLPFAKNKRQPIINIPYYLGSFNTNYIIARNVLFLKKNLKEKNKFEGNYSIKLLMFPTQIKSFNLTSIDTQGRGW